MDMLYPTLQQFLPIIRTLQADRQLLKQDLLTERFLIEKDGDLEIYYAPHNEWVNKGAKIVIVGITPGWGQMKTAFEQFIKSNKADHTLETCLIETKRAAGFAGSMRTNLISMLNQCNLHKILNIPNSSYLFEENRHLLHTTSIIKYPVFSKGKNYTGHYPAIDRSPVLQHYAYNEFPKELTHITPPALVIPLGKTVEQTISRLSKEQDLPNHHYLTGFPHPSGANGHRIKQFHQQIEQLQENIKTWADRLG